MAADRSDDQPGVLGNLPRSRPGRRSEKRTSGTTAKKRPAATRSTATRPAAAKRPPARPARPPRPTARPRPAPTGSADPVTGAVRIAGKVAEAGVKTAVGIIKRIPGV